MRFKVVVELIVVAAGDASIRVALLADGVRAGTRYLSRVSSVTPGLLLLLQMLMVLNVTALARNFRWPLRDH